MKRLSLLLAVCAVASATAAQAQCVSNSAVNTTVAVPATLTGTVLVEDTGARDIPIGVNEIGRYARFIGDHRLLNNEIQFKNRDFQAWKPVYAPTSRELTDNRLRGLAVDSNRTSGRRVAVRSLNLSTAPVLMYF